MNPLIPKTQTEYKLYQLQAEWQRSFGKARLAIAQSILDHPEWDLEIGADGPRLKTATQTAEKSNLSLVEALSNPSLSKNC
jgi:hypothetical protein